MMPMQSMPRPLSDFEFPSAVLMARLADVVVNNNVLHRMVQPTEQGTEVISANRMVNVVPFRRVYRFDDKEMLNQFCNELLKRPLVMQPVVHIGRGLGSGSMACGLCYKDDKWVMLVNQTHPKVLGRLQIGLDAAKAAMARGQSCEIRFAFSEMVEKVYKENMNRQEQEDTAKALDLFKNYFRYADWEYGDLIIRYMGYAARFGRGGGLNDMSTLNLTFRFEDIMSEEIGWRTLGAQHYPKPHLTPITEDEIRECLPAWTVNGVSPLENIGEQAPAANYSYSQAGRLYDSFRKKKRRPRADDRAGDDQPDNRPATIRPTVTDGIELRVLDQDDDQRLGARPTDRYPPYQGYPEGAYDSRAEYSPVAVHQPSAQWRGHREDDGYYEGKGAKPKRGPQFDTHGHMYPEVRVNSGTTTTTTTTNMPRGDAHAGAASRMYSNSPSTPGATRSYPPHSPQENQAARPYPHSPRDNPGASPYAHPSVGQDNHEYSSLRDQFTRVRMHGSDRSSHSETGSGMADSGISSDNDGHVREASYDKPVPSAQKSPHFPYAMDNHGYHDDEADVDDALRKHKELVARMMGGGQVPASNQGANHSPGYDDSRQRHPTANARAGDYADRYGPAHGKAAAPPSLALPVQHYDGRNTHHAAYSPSTHSPSAHSPSAHSPSAHSPSAHSPRMPVEESFI